MSLEEIESVTLPLGLKIERDMYWEPQGTLIEYYNKAKAKGEICDL